MMHSFCARMRCSAQNCDCCALGHQSTFAQVLAYAHSICLHICLQATEIASKLGALWKELDDKGKEKYNKQAEVGLLLSQGCCIIVCACVCMWTCGCMPIV